MVLYQAILAYDGTDFAGFQRQTQKRTVQGVVETALRSLGWQETAIRYAGRTDSGVHARGQVIAFQLAWKHSPQALQRALNALLPADVRARAVQPATADFHPRYAAVARRYVYYIYIAPQRDPFWRRLAWQVWPPPATETLQTAATMLVGRRDFAALGTPPNPRGTTVRTVYKAAWTRLGSHAWAFDVVADAFLYRMVRRMVALQVAVAQERLDLHAWQTALAQPPKAPLQRLAPPQGLFLEAVCYDETALQQCIRAVPQWVGGAP